MLPIFAVTILLLLSASFTSSRIYIHQTKRAAVSSNLEILSQTATSLSLVNDHISGIAVEIQNTPLLGRALSSDLNDITAEWEARQNLSRIFSGMPAAMVDYELVLVGANGIVVGSGNGGVTCPSSELLTLPALQTAIHTDRIAYEGRKEGFTFLTQHIPVIYGCRPLTGSDGSLYGALFILIPEQSLRQFYQSFSSQSTSILLLSSDGTILSSNLTDDIGEKNQSLLFSAKENQKRGREYSELSGSWIVLSRYLPYYDAYIVSQITSSLLLNEFWPRIQSILVICTALLLLMLLSFFIIRKNLLPLRTLANHMKDAKGIPDPIILSDTSDTTEIQGIASAYNQMITSLNSYVKEIDEAHERRRQDELSILQMQINPHFLYNTLDSVKHMVEMKNTSEACRTIDSLISLFRSTLNKTNKKVSVSDELQNIRNYISIISPRYGGLIQADADAMPDCANLEIPNLLLQPLVENAFFHAFQQTKSGSIHIFIYQNKGKLYCDIADTGDGMSKEQVAMLLHASSTSGTGNQIGISNVRDRLAILYPEENGFEIISERGYGTHIMLSFPARRCNS